MNENMDIFEWLMSAPPEILDRADFEPLAVEFREPKKFVTFAERARAVRYRCDETGRLVPEDPIPDDPRRA